MSETSGFTTSPLPRYYFQVITRVPDPLVDDGNLYDLLGDLYTSNGRGEEETISQLSILDAMDLHIKHPLYQLGEISIVDGSTGRDIPQGRKVTKWNVAYEEFAELTPAIARSLQVTKPQRTI